MYVGECIVDTKQALQWSLWTDETDFAEHLAVQPVKGATLYLIIRPCRMHQVQRCSVVCK